MTGFSEHPGKALRIAVIDSGINPRHPHVRDVAGGLSFDLNPEGEVITSDDFRDTIGHGTAIAGVIREKAPNAEIYAVKIFHSALKAPSFLLFAALEWAVRNRMKIIHLSLGTVNEEDRDALENLCRSAYDKDIMIIAAARSHDDLIFPAVFETVIAAYHHPECDGARVIHHPNCPIEFGACGYPRPLPGLPRELNFRGHSFAAAHITAGAARILEKHPYAEPSGVREELIRENCRCL